METTETMDAPARTGSVAAPPAARRAMGELRAVLVDRGYAALYHQLVSPRLFAADRADALGRLAALEGPDRALMTFCALGLEVDAAALGGLAPALDDAGLLARRGGSVAPAGFVVVPVLGGLVLTGVPPTYAGSDAIGACAYVGHDSLLLASVLPPTAGRRVLDLGCGCGLQGLLAAPGAREAVLTDIESTSVTLSALNAALNETSHPLRILVGDLYEPVDGEKFDLIVTLPPYLPTVPGSGTSAVVAGGRDGLGLIRRLVADTPAHLAPGGELVAVCQLVCTDDGPLLADELPSLVAGLEARLVVADWHPLHPYLLQLAAQLHDHGSSTPTVELLAAYAASLRGLGATGVCTAVLRVRRPVTPSRGAVRVVGRVPDLRAGDVVQPAPGLELAPTAGLQVAGATGVEPAVVEAATAALVAALDGRRTVAQAADAAWGPLPEETVEDLLDQAVERVGQLARQGLVHLPGAGPA